MCPIHRTKTLNNAYHPLSKILVLVLLTSAWPCHAKTIKGGRGPTPKECAALFHKIEVIQLELTSDYKKISDERMWNTQSGLEIQDGSDSVFTDAILTELGVDSKKTVSAQVRARGNSSSLVTESEFPKLKVKIGEKESTAGTEFEGVKGFRVNTHVSTFPKTPFTPLGRVNSELAPWREGLVYELARQLGLATPATRQARITYIDVNTRETFTRNALLIETDGAIEKRWNAKMMDSFELQTSENSGIDPVDGAKFHLFQALIGNADYSLRVNEEKTSGGGTYQAIRNAAVLKTKSGRRVPVVYDLDLAGISRQVDQGSAHPEFGIPEAGDKADFFEFGSRLFAHFPKEDLRVAVDFFKTRKDALYEAVRTYQVDLEGRSLAQQYLDTFFNHIDELLDLQVVASEDARFFRDAKGLIDKMPPDPITEEPGILRLGTPIRILGKEGDFLKVAILDPYRDVLSTENLIGYIPARTVIAPSLSREQVRKFDIRELVWSGHQ